MSLFSQGSKYNLRDGVNLKSNKGAMGVASVLNYPDLRMATVTRLEPDRLRFEFSKPFQFSVFYGSGWEYVTEKTIRSFIVITRQDLADKIMDLHRGRYLVIDGSTPKHIQKIVNESLAHGTDYLIREFHRGRLAPRILKFESLHFFADFEMLGHPQGVPVEQFSMETLDFSNPQYLDYKDENDFYEDATPSQIQRFVDYDEVPLVETYLDEMLKVSRRTKELLNRNWLHPIINERKSPRLALMQEASLIGKNVVAFSVKRSCQQIFKR